MPITKHNFIVKDVKVLADTLRRAFKIAAEGRPGPVLIDVAKDVTSNTTSYTPKEPEEILPVTDTIKEKDIKKALELISKSKKPYVFVGGGVIASGANEEVLTFAKLLDAPVTDSLMGNGAFDETHKLYTGMLGMHGTKTSNFGVSKCDLLVVIGARFSDRDTGNTRSFAKNAKIIHIDIDPAEINKNIKSTASIIGDAKEILKRLNAELEQQSHKEWLKEIADAKKKYAVKVNDKKLNGPLIIEKLYELTEGDAVISTDVGQHQMWAAQHYKFTKPRHFITSGGLGTMGFGLGAAIGAKVGVPDKTVVNIAGDGCFRMNMNELATASRYGIPVIEIVINNQVLGMVRQWQDLFYDKRYSNTTLKDQVDFVKVSEGLGAKAYKVETLEEFEKAFKNALKDTKKNVPVMIECMIDSDDKVFPMVSPGGNISEAFDASDLKKK